MVRSHPGFKHHTNEECNKIPPLLKVSKKDEKNGISHAYQKLKGFYKGMLNLGPDYIRDARMEEWLTREHISMHEISSCSETLIKKKQTRITLYSHKEMDLETAQNNAVVKFPLLNQGDYDMTKLRIEQYIQLEDYALWEVIENGNSFKPQP
ncbi:hypothetical protein Tco_0489847 [Tanacetum coccineum]